MTLTETQLYDYAADLILEHAQDVEFLTISETAEERVPGGEISDEDMRSVNSLIHHAIVTVTWAARPKTFYDNQVDDDDETVETDE